MARATRSTIGAQRLTLVAVAIAVAGAQLPAQDTTARSSPAASVRSAARLQVTFKPPVRGTARDSTVPVSGSARALVPSARIDALVPQTMRAAPFVSICVTNAPDSARLVVRVRDVLSAVMISLRPGLNRVALGEARFPLADGDVAEWSLRSLSGELLVRDQIQRHVVAATPTINSLARNGIWYDALDLFVLDAIRELPLAAERLEAFMTGVGAAACARATASPSSSLMPPAEPQGVHRSGAPPAAHQLRIVQRNPEDASPVTGPHD